MVEEDTWSFLEFDIGLSIISVHAIGVAANSSCGGYPWITRGMPTMVAFALSFIVRNKS